MAKVDFNGNGQELERITAKKNYASSMQSHKMGACLMFNKLHRYMAENYYPNIANEVNGPAAVEQYPILGFQEVQLEGTEDFEQRYIGLYTVGADKGDKGYFGFKDSRVKNTAIRMEGTDHIKGVGFNYPWRVGGVKTMRYNDSKEAICIVTGEDKSKWTAVLEVSHCGSAETESEKEAYLEEVFLPTHEMIYNNNPLLVGTYMTIQDINADIESFKKLKRTDGRPYSLCEFWINGEYDVYYLNQERNQYEKNGLNLYDVLSDEDKAKVDDASTLEEKNAIFIAHRVNTFKGVAEQRISVDNALFMVLFCLMIAASDNFEKNMYPYIMILLLRFFNDDLDSILPTDNQAQDTKRYSVELHDFTDSTQSAYVFKGEDNALLHLLEMAFPERFAQMGKDMLQSIYTLSPKGTKTLDRLNGFYEAIFFDNAQNYFPVSAYNNDAEVSYEEAWNNKSYVASVDIHPLAQSLGNHYTTERRFINLRNVYLMSKFGFGGFASYEDNSLGVISVRTQDPVGFTLTPAIDMYPTILGGQAQVSKSEKRVEAGQSVTLPAVGGGNTNVYIVAADYLVDIGDLKDLPIDPSSVVALNVSSKRLRRLKIGDAVASSVTSYLAGLNLQRCDSLETIDARNLVSLRGNVDLSNCPRLYLAYFKGTSVSSVVVPTGSKIEELSLPDTITTLTLRGLVKLTLDNFDYGTLENLAYLRIEDNTNIDGYEMLKIAIQNGNLEAVRVLGIDAVGTSEDLKVLEALAESGAKGINADGEVDANLAPIVEGKLTINGSANGKLYEKVVGLYPSLEIVVTGGVVYAIEFEDPEVERICVENWGSDGMITYQQAAAVTNIALKFQNNTLITSFNELDYFKNVTELTNYAFQGCSNLKYIKSTHVQKIGGGLLRQCPELLVVEFPNLTYVNENGQNFAKESTKLWKIDVSKLSTPCGNMFSLPSLTDLKWDNVNCVSLANYVFQNCGLEFDVNLPKLQTMRNRAFMDSKIKKIVSLGELSELEDFVFYRTTNLDEAHLPLTLTTIETDVFRNSSVLSIDGLDNVVTIGSSFLRNATRINKIVFGDKLTSIGEYMLGSYGFTPAPVNVVVVKAVTPPSIISNTFWGFNGLIYVPDESVEEYKTATNWSAQAARIFPLSEYQG